MKRLTAILSLLPALCGLSFTAAAQEPEMVVEEVSAPVEDGGGAPAVSIDAARQAAEDGSLSTAIDILRNVISAEPSNTDAQLLMAEYLWSSGRDDEARGAYELLRKKGDRRAILALSHIALDSYDIDGARSLLEAYRKTLTKGRKQLAQDESGNLEETIDRAEELLSRVQNIEVIDSVDVDFDRFFAAYPLSPAAGRLSGSEVLPDGFPADGQTVVHTPESGSRMVWSAPGADGSIRLYGSNRLLGGEWEAPVELGAELGDGGDALYPFLMPDGITLYYANDGANSLGGYDIFQTREGENGYLQPANLGLPFNSTANDYLLVIDEFTGAGWFATDRNRHPGKVTIYTFIPQDLRVNVDPEDPQLAALASLSDISLTRKPGKNYNSVFKAIADGQAMDSAPAKAPDFLLSLPDGRVYTSLGDFNNPDARDAMKTYLAKEKKLRQILADLQELRRKYASGDTSVSQVILQVEANLPSARRELLSLRNDAITLETR